MADLKEPKYYYNKILDHDDGSGWPDSDSAVYQELLFKALHGGSPDELMYRNVYSPFESVLKGWKSKKTPFDLNKFNRDIRALRSRRLSRHIFYFGIPVKDTRSKLPFGKRITISDCTFRQLTYKQMQHSSRELAFKYIGENYVSDAKFKKADVDDALSKNFLFFSASVSAPTEIQAANLVEEAVASLSGCVSLAEVGRTYVHHILSPSTTSIETRAPLPRPAYFIGANLPFSSLVTPRLKTDAKLQLSTKRRKIAYFKRLIKVHQTKNPTPIDRRIQTFTVEFERAMESNNPEDRALSLWRCMERAITHSKHRKEIEIVSIISHFKSSETWREQGKLILEFRNDHVHRGRLFHAEMRDNYLIWVQQYASATVSLLMWMRDNKIGLVDDAEVDDTFDLYSKPSATFKIAAKMKRAKDKLSTK